MARCVLGGAGPRHPGVGRAWGRPEPSGPARDGRLLARPVGRRWLRPWPPKGAGERIRRSARCTRRASTRRAGSAA
eukprot:5587981-Lingulodinium_polyedra.AAC.1